jgi:hypothetical protein
MKPPPGCGASRRRWPAEFLAEKKGANQLVRPKKETRSGHNRMAAVRLWRE